MYFVLPIETALGGWWDVSVGKRALAVKADDLNLIPGIHMVRENQLMEVIFDLNPYTVAPMFPLKQN